MLALSPSIGWPLEDFNFNTTNSASSESLFNQQVDQSSAGDPLAVKKLNHNASERDRRKKINNLYSSLRSSLPASDQKKRLSVPATVSRVIKYIPELQEQVENLNRKKNDLRSRICKQGDMIHRRRQENRKQNMSRNSFSAVSVNQLGDAEIVIQISMYRHNQNTLSQILLNLADYGFVLLNASSSSSFGGLIIYSLHFQCERIYKLDCEELSEKLKLQSLCDRREQQSVYFME